MTLRQAIEARIPRVRLPNWAPTAYILLPKEGVWASLIDPPGQTACNMPVGSQKICLPLHADDEAGFEPYEGPVSPHEP